MTAGLVVAGGYSTRFGIVEKPLVEVGGEAMLVRVVRTLDAIVDDIVIDCRADQVSPFRAALQDEHVEPTYAIDDDPDRGPIAGLANGLASIDASEATVLSCDRPGVTPALLASLRFCRRHEDVDVAVPALDGFLQPLCGVYRTDALRTAVESALATGNRRLCGIPRELTSTVATERALADVVDPAAISSVDTPVEAQLWSVPVEASSARSESRARRDASRSLAGD